MHGHLIPTPVAGREAGTLPVVEVFGPTLQGEGRAIGRKVLFVRLAGCDWACRWCDTAYAWRPGEMAPVERLSPEAVVRRLLGLDPACRAVTLTGGNPALHDCAPLVGRLHSLGFTVHVETQGSRAPVWLATVDSVTVSPKGPSSGMAPDWDALAATLARARDPELKVVVFDEADYAYARCVHARFPQVPFCLQVGHRTGADSVDTLLARARWLAETALADAAMQGVRVLPQLHVLLWGNRRGV